MPNGDDRSPTRERAGVGHLQDTRRKHRIGFDGFGHSSEINIRHSQHAEHLHRLVRQWRYTTSGYNGPLANLGIVVHVPLIAVSGKKFTGKSTLGFRLSKSPY